MLLQNELYKIENYQDDERKFSLELIPDNVIYRAHFPERAITPGVCIIQIATELAEILAERPLHLTSVVNAKFLAVIDPAEGLDVEYHFQKYLLDVESGELKTSVVVRRGDTVFSKLSLAYRL